MLVLSPADVCRRGFYYHKNLPNFFDGELNKQKIDSFKKYYGSSPHVVAALWSDLQATEGCNIPDKYKSEKGFFEFCIVLHFLWAYPKNADILADSFSVCKRLVEGGNLWRWVEQIAKLKAKAIVWPEAYYNDPDSPIYIVTVDGVDYRTWERKHPTYSKDTKSMSHKFKHGALKYEVAVDVFLSKIVWTNGPFLGGVHDGTIF